MTKRRTFLATSGALAASALLPSIVTAQTRTPFTFCTPFGFIADFIEIMNAHTGGHWRDQGLDSKVVGAQGTSPAIQQLVAGQAQMIRAASIDFMRAVAQQNLPLVAVSTIYQGSTFFMISPEEKPIRRAADMQGKKIGIVSVGGTTDLFIDSSDRRTHRTADRAGHQRLRRARCAQSRIADRQHERGEGTLLLARQREPTAQRAQAVARRRGGDRESGPRRRHQDRRYPLHEPVRRSSPQSSTAADVT